jgi:hypothetical protein
VDTELSSIASIATPRSQIANDALVSSTTLARWSSDDLRPVRIALAEYARQSRIYDPVDVVAFTRLCIRGATQRLIESGKVDTDALFHEALQVASESCGVCKQRSSNAMSTPEKTQNISDTSDSVRKASIMIARASEPKIIVPVPEPHGRTMPPQPLGELPDVRPARLWNTLVQAAWRSVGTLLSSMFVRSE